MWFLSWFNFFFFKFKLSLNFQPRCAFYVWLCPTSDFVLTVMVETPECGVKFSSCKWMSFISCFNTYSVSLEHNTNNTWSCGTWVLSILKIKLWHKENFDINIWTFDHVHHFFYEMRFYQIVKSDHLFPNFDKTISPHSFIFCIAYVPTFISLTHS